MLILKSASPRRQQILKDLRLTFGVEPSHVDEDVRVGESPLSYLKRVTIAKLELEKAKSEEVYISSDTIVVLNEQILGKP
ncbi:MAG TPA: Maf family protein, partial [Leptospiraceae bacterium]|nr:Maf family protein [Leptospiraceae bacterium]